MEKLLDDFVQVERVIIHMYVCIKFCGIDGSTTTLDCSSGRIFLFIPERSEALFWLYLHLFVYMFVLFIYLSTRTILFIAE